MGRYKHILLATDLSKFAKQVAKTAADFAKAMDAKLSIVHVQEYTPTLFGEGESTIALDVNLEQLLLKQAEEAMATLAKSIHIPVDQTFIKTGSIKRETVDLAELLDADLIVVGSHGRGGFNEALLGSSANAILHEAKCDVYEVRLVK